MAAGGVRVGSAQSLRLSAWTPARRHSLRGGRSRPERVAASDGRVDRADETQVLGHRLPLRLGKPFASSASLADVAAGDDVDHEALLGGYDPRVTPLYRTGCSAYTTAVATHDENNPAAHVEDCLRLAVEPLVCAAQSPREHLTAVAHSNHPR